MSTLSSDVRTLSSEAYVYLYPLVLMDVTRQQSVSGDPGANPTFGAPNQFHHLRAFPTAEFRSVVRPNFDTLYSSAWLDLTNGPVHVHAGDSGDRYYMLPMLDMWTDVFANPGKRTTGTGELDLVITGPGYAGPTPQATHVISAPTPYAWIIGRTQTNGPDDYAAVAAFQDTLSITAPARLTEHSVDTIVDGSTEPLRFVNALSAVDFFRYAARAMAVNAPHATDFSQLARIAALGIAPGADFDPGRFDADQLAELEAGVAAARADLVAGVAQLGTPVDGWAALTGTIGVYGNGYFRRAVIALAGLGANPPEDAIYPLLHVDADGDPMAGEIGYVMHFDAGSLPPADAFWSITMYDEEGYQVANDINRFAIGDRDQLTVNTDGSLDIYLQHANPGPDREANWLPAPKGPLGVTMRLYAPKPQALNGAWSPPPVRKA